MLSRPIATGWMRCTGDRRPAHRHPPGRAAPRRPRARRAGVLMHAGVLMAVRWTHAAQAARRGASRQDDDRIIGRGTRMHGGDLVAKVLWAQGVRFLFTLCGGHISPILVGAKAPRHPGRRHPPRGQRGVRRRRGRPADRRARRRGGDRRARASPTRSPRSRTPSSRSRRWCCSAAPPPTVLKGRGALQDIDQMALMRPHVKWARAVRRVARHRADARAGVPGRASGRARAGVRRDARSTCSTTRRWCASGTRAARPGRDGLARRACRLYLRLRVRAAVPRRRQVADPVPRSSRRHPHPRPRGSPQGRAAAGAAQAAGDSRSAARHGRPAQTPSGSRRRWSARRAGLPLRHGARPARRRPPAADCATAAGGAARGRPRAARRRARRLPARLRQPHPAQGLPGLRQPQPRATCGRTAGRTSAMHADAGPCRRRLAEALPDRRARPLGGTGRAAARPRRRARGRDRRAWPSKPPTAVNPLRALPRDRRALPPDSGAGGRRRRLRGHRLLHPAARGPLRWLDPGVFGTLGVGGGFALGAKRWSARTPRCGSSTATARSATASPSSTPSCATAAGRSRSSATTPCWIADRPRAGRDPARRRRHRAGADALRPHRRPGTAPSACTWTTPTTSPKRWPRPGQPASPSSSTSESAEPTSAKTRSQCDRYNSHGSTGRPRAGAEQHTHPESSLAGVSPVRVAGIRAAVPRTWVATRTANTRVGSRATSYHPQSASARDNRRTPRPTGARLRQGGHATAQGGP